MPGSDAGSRVGHPVEELRGEDVVLPLLERGEPAVRRPLREHHDVLGIAVVPHRVQETTAVRHHDDGDRDHERDPEDGQERTEFPTEEVSEVVLEGESHARA